MKEIRGGPVVLSWCDVGAQVFDELRYFLEVNIIGRVQTDTEVWLEVDQGLGSSA